MDAATPRTDALRPVTWHGNADAEWDHYRKLQSLSRSLERELASLRAEKQRLEETQRKFGLWQHELMQRAERAEQQRDEAVEKMQRGWLEVTESGINHYKQVAERAEAEVQEQCRLNAMGAEREAKLMAELKTQARESYADVEEWAAYASEYFREKWDLHGTLQKWRDRFETTGEKNE